MWGILPPHLPPILAVLKNECGQTFTFSVEGEDVYYLGKDDRHDSKYDEMVLTENVFQYAGAVESLEKYKGVPLNDVCNYRLSVHPTQEMEDEFITARPWIFFAAVLGLFVLTGISIYCYDWRVEKNYEEVYTKAKKAGAIVSSMFPEAVRKRLYNDDNSSSNEKGQGAFRQEVPDAVHAQKLKLKGFLNESGVMPQMPIAPQPSREEGEKEIMKDLENAICDNFPATTILFAEIVGFTAWSSQREPGEVFTLLQTLYHEFDMAARSLSVFKVETIGDCYVAGKLFRSFSF